MLFKECFKIHIIEYCANQGNVFPKKSSYCKDHAVQGFVNQGPTVQNSVWNIKNIPENQPFDTLSASRISEVSVYVPPLFPPAAMT